MVRELVELKIVRDIDKRKDFDSRESSCPLQKLALKLEVKLHLKSFGGEIDIEKLNQWLKQIEVYF